jgi:dephospho-CoA kinase
MLVVGLTGGIGSGKSTAAEQFEKLGALRIDMDRIARGLVSQDSEYYSGQCMAEIRAEFGDDIFSPDQSLNRDKLRELVFADQNQRERLENILHPAINTIVKTLLQGAQNPVCIVEIPLLNQRDQFEYLDRILVIDADKATRVKRIQDRGRLNKSQINAIMDAQLDTAARLALADDVISNNGSVEELHQQVNTLYQHYLSISNKQ